MSITKKFVMSKISPLKYMITLVSLVIGLTIPVFVLDDPKYTIVAVPLVISSALVLYALRKVSRGWIKHCSFFATMAWLFLTLFAIYDGHWEAAVWLTLPNVIYFTYFYFFASLRMEFIHLGEE